MALDDWDRLRIVEAARNNAHLYERVCGSHGCRTEVTDTFLICLDSPPRFYGQAVTLAPLAFPELSHRLTGGFKDSFFDADPDSSQFEVLFEAQWIWLEPGEDERTTLDWRRVRTDSALLEWEKAWAENDPEAAENPRQFPLSLLDTGDLFFYGAFRNARLKGGALLNLSGAVLGISNAFSLDLSEDELWRDLAALTRTSFPNLPVTGYERGDSLEFAVKAGFRALAPLRVWLPKG